MSQFSNAIIKILLYRYKRKIFYNVVIWFFMNQLEKLEHLQLSEYLRQSCAKIGYIPLGCLKDLFYHFCKGQFNIFDDLFNGIGAQIHHLLPHCLLFLVWWNKRSTGHGIKNDRKSFEATFRFPAFFIGHYCLSRN